MSSTLFGFRSVPEGAKEGLVRGVFSSVARRYDLMNDLMSGGIHRLWKDAMVDWLNPRPRQNFVDVAGGTGDIARRIALRCRERGASAGSVCVCDSNPDMVVEGMRALSAASESDLSWLCGNAMDLPFNDASFDAFTIAFGIRNVTHIDRALVEARRVLRPGGRFLCLEFSHVDAPGLDSLYDTYSFAVLPRLGQLVAGDADAYRYLVESIRRFPSQREFAGMIAAAGLGRVRVRSLTGGIAALHSAWKL